MTYARYAVWWVPRRGSALARFGLDWTGWCADRGVAAPVLADAARRRVIGAAALTGLHATVRSPFRLAAGRSLWGLEAAMGRLADRTAALDLPPLELRVVDGRLLLVPSRPDEAVTRLLIGVREAVADFRHRSFRSPAAGASPARPESFRFPLTGPLEPAVAEAMAAELASRLAPVLARPQRIAELALAGDPGGGRPWRVMERYALDGETELHPTRAAEMASRGPRLMAPLGARRLLQTIS